MAWDYAELSKLTKANGGPEKLIDTLINNGIKTGRSQMLPVVGAVAGVAVAVGVVGKTTYDKLKTHFADRKNKEEMQDARDELIEGIKAYDAEHPDDSEISPAT
ncbi:MAG: hypothetical protein LUF92_03835 [Clostridiales bacterium]|nr:hypothetical protein [Clostridiales bacterium]